MSAVRSARVVWMLAGACAAWLILVAAWHFIQWAALAAGGWPA